MPRSVSSSVEEHNASTCPSFSFSSRRSLELPQWPASLPEGPNTPEYPESRKKKIRTAPPSPPISYYDIQDSPVEPSKVQITDGYRTPRTPSPAPLDRRLPDRIPYLPTPPESQDGDHSERSLDPVYPVQPRALPQYRPAPLPSRGRSREPGFRTRAVDSPQSASTTSPDRYISNRKTFQAPTSGFRLGKPPHLLSDAEKLLRHDSATPDPFVSGSPRRTRRGRSLLSSSLSRSTSRSQSRSVSNPDVLTVSHPSLPSPQLRQASAGAVWNIGGGSHHRTGPVQGISDGRGGLIGSGTNAPLYTARFLSEGDPTEDRDTFENRLAVALEIDRTRRTLDFSRPRPRERRVSGSKRKRADCISRTQWKYGEWTREGDISCK